MCYTFLQFRMTAFSFPGFFSTLTSMLDLFVAVLLSSHEDILG
jgi:hypothetical protein